MSSTAGTNYVSSDPIIAEQRKKAHEIRQALLMWPESPIITETTIEIVSTNTIAIEPRASFSFMDFCKDSAHRFFNSIVRPLVSWLFGYVDYSEGFEEITPDFFHIQKTKIMYGNAGEPDQVITTIEKPDPVVAKVKTVSIGDNVTFKFSSYSTSTAELTNGDTLVIDSSSSFVTMPRV